MMKVFRDAPAEKIVYIAPLKALVRERIEDWRKHLCPKLGKRLVELTGDYTPDLRALLNARHHRRDAREVGRHLAPVAESRVCH